MRTPIHPSEIFIEEFCNTVEEINPQYLKDYNKDNKTYMLDDKTINKLASIFNMSPDVWKKFFRKEYSIDTKFAYKLFKLFGMSAKFWINLQTMYDEDVFNLNISIDGESDELKNVTHIKNYSELFKEEK